MVCKQCGATVADGDVFCSACGAKVEAEETVVENAEVEAVVSEVEAETKTEPTIPYEERPNSGKAIAGFITALAGWFFTFLPASIVGLVLSIMGKRETGENGKYKGKGFATAGLVFSILGIVGAILGTILGIVFYVFYIMMLAGGGLYY